jgi:hypothetical protein
MVHLCLVGRRIVPGYRCVVTRSYRAPYASVYWGGAAIRGFTARRLVAVAGDEHRQPVSLA